MTRDEFLKEAKALADAHKQVQEGLTLRGLAFVIHPSKLPIIIASDEAGIEGDPFTPRKDWSDAAERPTEMGELFGIPLLYLVTSFHPGVPESFEHPILASYPWATKESLRQVQREEARERQHRATIAYGREDDGS